jgi:predicted permease
LLTLLLAAVMLVLAIATANAANLLSMRNESRRSELAVRMALGAGRWKIATQLITESLLLALVAGAVGLTLAWWSLQILVATGTFRLPRVDSVRIDAVVMLSALVVAIVSALGVALAPVWVLHGNLITYLKSGGRGSPGAASRRLRQSFVAGQVALAVTLLAAAGLLAHSVLRLQAIDTGLPTDRLVFVELSLPPQHTDRAWHAAFLERLMTDLSGVPFLAAATPVNGLPYPGISGWDVPRFTAEGQSAEEAASNPSLNLESVFPNYFATFEVPMARGRAFAESDRQGTPAVAIVSEDVASRIWPGGDAIGKRLKMGGPDSREEWLTVVGVSKPVRLRELMQDRPTLYLPAAQFLMTAQRIAVRTAAPLDQVAAAVRERLRSVEPSAHVMQVVTFGEILAQPLARPRFNAFVLGLFAAVAVLLATVGLYAVMRTYVRQRDRDIAVRRALGASAADVQRLVVGEALRMVGVGVVVGLAGAVGAARVVRSMLYGITPMDPAALAGAVLMLTVVSLCAAYLPARHAVRVDPLVALRHD